MTCREQADLSGMFQLILCHQFTPACGSTEELARQGSRGVCAVETPNCVASSPVADSMQNKKGYPLPARHAPYLHGVVLPSRD
jgi:hypothetical protein